MTDCSSLIDGGSYPIFDLETDESKEFFKECRGVYEKTGALSLPNFLTAKTLTSITRDALSVEHLSFKQTKHHNVYLLDTDPKFDKDHPRNRVLITTNSTISYADIKSQSLLRDLYHCSALQNFIAFVTGKSAIFPYVDALSPLNIGVSRTGETLAWHFDTSDFATTLMLQAPLEGGEFEFVSKMRTQDDLAFSKVEKLLDGDLEGVQSTSVEAGTLVLFQGRHAIHRVAPVKGDLTRMMAILTYDEKPNQRMNAYTQEKFYGHSA